MNPISVPVQAVLDLFADPLRDVRFGDVDAKTLTELAAVTRAAAEVVAAAEAELMQARVSLQERQDALLVSAQRALAYARVYAEANPALAERLDQIALPRAARRTKTEGEGLALQLQPDPQPTGKRERSADGARRLRAVKAEEPVLDAVSEG